MSYENFLNSSFLRLWKFLWWSILPCLWQILGCLGISPGKSPFGALTRFPLQSGQTLRGRLVQNISFAMSPIRVTCQPSYGPISLMTTAADLGLALGLATWPLVEVLDLIWHYPHPTKLGALQLLYYKVFPLANSSGWMDLQNHSLASPDQGLRSLLPCPHVDNMPAKFWPNRPNDLSSRPCHCTWSRCQIPGWGPRPDLT